MAGGGSSEGGEPEFQIAPMIDVLLVILIFFMMITSAQVLKVDKTITLPAAPHAVKKDNQRAESVVNVRWNSKDMKPTFVFEDRPYTGAAQLIPLIKAAKSTGEKKIAAGNNPEFRAVIRGDRDVPARFVSQAMDAAAAAGISDISFSTLNK
jgi:biopolymer transport protein ExbD